MENLDKQFLTTQELADRWRKSKRTLENQSCMWCGSVV